MDISACPEEGRKILNQQQQCTCVHGVHGGGMRQWVTLPIFSAASPSSTSQELPAHKGNPPVQIRHSSSEGSSDPGRMGSCIQCRFCAPAFAPRRNNPPPRGAPKPATGARRHLSAGAMPRAAQQMVAQLLGRFPAPVYTKASFLSAAELRSVSPRAPADPSTVCPPLQGRHGKVGLGARGGGEGRRRASTTPLFDSFLTQCLGFGQLAPIFGEVDAFIRLKVAPQSSLTQSQGRGRQR